MITFFFFLEHSKKKTVKEKNLFTYFIIKKFLKKSMSNGAIQS